MQEWLLGGRWLQEVPAACCRPEESVSSDQGESTFELRACCRGTRIVRSRAGEALLAEAPCEQKHQEACDMGVRLKGHELAGGVGPARLSSLPGT